MIVCKTKQVFAKKRFTFDFWRNDVLQQFFTNVLTWKIFENKVFALSTYGNNDRSSNKSL